MSKKCVCGRDMVLRDWKCQWVCTRCGKTKPVADVPTNADRIRAMSDGELAEWLVSKTIYQESGFCPPSYLNFLTGFDDTKEIAIEGTVKWLKQPASDDER